MNDNVDNVKAISLDGLGIFKEKFDKKINEVSDKIPVVPESLPANGGNAEMADKLKTTLIRLNAGADQNNKRWVKFAEGTATISSRLVSCSLKTEDSNLSDYYQAYASNNVLGTLRIRFQCNNTDITRIEKSELIWEAVSASIRLDDFVLGYYLEGGQYRIACFVNLQGSYDGLLINCIMSMGNIQILSGYISEADYYSEIPPEYTTVIPSTTMPLLNTKALETELADLKAYIGYTDTDIYGLEVDFENNKFTRLAGAVGKNPGEDFDNVRAFGGRRRCNVYTNGTVVYDSTDTDGWDTSVVDVKQRLFSVMVEQPKFYYKVVPLKTEKIEGADGYHLRKARYYISDTPKAGFKVHPAFIQDNREVDKIYLSAFEGSIWSTESGRLTEDEQIANFDTDVLTSITDVKPASGATQAFTITNARKLAQNRGNGWGITSIQTLSVTQLLFIIEFASFNAQTTIGMGITQANQSVQTGNTLSLGNSSGISENGSVSYRGEENLWGSLSFFVDGLIINHFKCELTSNITNSFILPNQQGWIYNFGYDPNNDYLFLPSAVGGSSALPIGDMVIPTDMANRIVLCGGNYQDVTRPGLFYLIATLDPTWHGINNGARLVYFPTSSTKEVIAND